MIHNLKQVDFRILNILDTYYMTSYDNSYTLTHDMWLSIRL